MADMTSTQWATLVLNDLGAPTSANNMEFMAQWIASENSWPPPRNNPLNNGLGSGGGSGLGSYDNLTDAASFAAQNLLHGNASYGYAAVVQNLMASAPPATTAQAIIDSSWASSHYNNGANWSGGPIAYQGAPQTSAAPGMTAADWKALNAAGAAGGTAYLEAANAQSQGSTAQAATSVSASNSSLASTNIGGVGYSGTAQQTSALSTISGELQTYGFTPAEVSELTSWAWGEITNNVDPTQIAIDLQNQPAFQSAYPGFASANQALQAKGLSAVSVQQYQQYQTQAQAMAQAAGLPAGMINSQNIGTLIGGNVSTQELSSRLNDATVLALKSTPDQQAEFNQYFGTSYGDTGHGPLTTGQIAALALDPSVAEPLIAQQIQTAQIGGASVTAGVGALQKSTATELAQAGITTSQATSAFQNLAPLSALETPRPGMAGVPQGTVSADQLATGSLLGNPAAQRQEQTAVEVAKAPFSGGGGYVSTSHGTAVGSANPNGTGNT